jgi:hypothetical protein
LARMLSDMEELSIQDLTNQYFASNPLLKDWTGGEC